MRLTTQMVRVENQSRSSPIPVETAEPSNKHATGAPGAPTWAVANTHPHREKHAVENLVRQGFRPYCPLIRKRVRHARRSQDVLRPLFPGYVFVEIAPGQRWQSILSTYGVRTLIQTGPEVARLDTNFVESLKAREIDGAVTRPHDPYEIGDAVSFTSGPFAGLIARILEIDAQERIVLLLELLNQPVKVKADADQIERR